MIIKTVQIVHREGCIGLTQRPNVTRLRQCSHKSQINSRKKDSIQSVMILGDGHPISVCLSRRRCGCLLLYLSNSNTLHAYNLQAL